MINELVVDNSVWMKLVSSENEIGADISLVVYEKMRQGEILVRCPKFWLLEASNILSLRKKLSMNEVSLWIRKMISAGLMLEDLSEEEIPDLLRLRQRYNLSVYDAYYLLLAKKYKCKLLTADKQLLKVKKYSISLTDFERLIK
ncbi:type II toxin-antitoxin system VapC family toxin [Patescibacteria group bacterium]|nr:type II toxin-antitoxin system VapC family toxin [Patescibacteria group bacterium]MBU1457416.1 type II toxin-antitoxin system VapC family toxin [Patescibacteria group bacterium]